jgi:membrane-associated PAP2 superfamily phosphatase
VLSTALLWKRDVLIAVLGLLSLVVWDVCRLDLPTMRLLGGDQGFVWQEHWLTVDVLHRGGRWLSGLGLLTLVWNIWRPWATQAPLAYKPLAVWCLLSTLLCLLFISTIKRFSLTSCPWSLAEFGGTAQWVSHWAISVSDGGPGHCFPSGHASSAFAFFSVWFALRALHPRAALGYLLGLVMVGLILGGGQTLRGAHYPSHTFWTAWLCWVVAAVLWHASVRWVRT